ncbi:methyltransferase domain-containing protein [bacterium]|nr:methyltransferase domain-containing protein [bacterium]
MNDPVITHFDRTASEFDSIYSGKKSAFSRLLDRWLRWDMYERLRRSLDVVRAYPGVTVLDIGAGSGRFFLPLIEAGASHIVAVEPAEAMVAIARAHMKEVKIEDKVTIHQAAFLDWTNTVKCGVTLAIGLYDYLDDPVSYLKKSRDLTNQAMIASFPIRGTLRSAIRKVRLGMLKCPVFYYSQRQVEDLLRSAGYSSWEISKFGQLIFVVAKP